MKLAPDQRKDISSATLTQTLGLIVALSGLVVVVASAAQPAWWTSRGAVVAPQVTTNNGVVTTNYIPNNYAVVTQGQLKQFTQKAVAELNADLPGGAGPALTNLVYGWQQDYATNGYNATNLKPSDYDAMTVGQLKYVGSLVYSRLSAAGYTGLYPSWIVRNTNTDNIAANLGQLKSVFNFDLAAAPVPVTGLAASTASPGEIDLSWTLPTVNNATSLAIQQSTDGGTTWTTVATLGPTATSYAATGLDPSQTYNYRLSSSNSSGATSSSASTSGTHPNPPMAPAPTGLTGTIDGSFNMNLSWTASTGATSYVVEREALSTGIWSSLGTTSGATYQDTGYGAGGYHYRVSAVNVSGTSGPSGEFPQSRYAVIDLGINMYPMKITSGTGTATGGGPNPVYVLMGSNGSDELYYRWSNGQLGDPLTQPDGFLPWWAIDIDDNGRVVGLGGDSNVGYYLPSSTGIVVWPAGSTTPSTLSPSFAPQPDLDENPPHPIFVYGPIQDAGFVDTTYVSMPLGGNTLLVSPHDIWTSQVVSEEWGGWYTYDESYFSDMFQTPNGGSATELGNFQAVLSYPGDGGSAPYTITLTGSRVTVLAANSSDQTLLENDSNFQASNITDYNEDSNWHPQTTTYTVAGNTVPFCPYLPNQGQGINIFPKAQLLSNVALGKSYVLGSDAQVSWNANGMGLPIYSTIHHYYCWDGTNQMTLPQPGSTPTIIPQGVNAATTTLTSGSTTTTVAATQVIGSGYIWDMVPTTSTTKTFGPPQNLSDLIPARSGFQNISAASINDGGAIVGTATHISTGTGDPIAAGSHGVLLIPLKIRFAAPTDPTWADLDEKQVILFSDATRIHITIPMAFTSLSQMTAIPEFSKIHLKTDVTLPAGVDVPLTSSNCTLSAGTDPNTTDLKIVLIRDDLKDLGLLPHDDDDGIDEKSWYDWGSQDTTSPHNLTDSMAFDAASPAVSLGQCSAYGHLSDKPPKKPNSPLDKTYLQAAGREVITVSMGGLEGEPRAIAHQADTFYISAEGHIVTGLIDTDGENSDSVTFGASDAKWDHSLKTLVVGGCSVLAIGDYVVNSLSPKDLLYYQAKSVYAGYLTSPPSPGTTWEGSGPKYLLGYDYSAPTDSQGAAGIATSFASHVAAGMNPIAAWGTANNLRIGDHACAIDVSVSPHQYWYFKRTQSGLTTATFTWTCVTKTSSGWPSP